jgi:oligosaccharyltransferase complex subunit beta
LRYSNVTHRLSNGGVAERQLKHKIKANLARSMFPEPEIAPNSLVYRIKDDIVFSLVIEELTDEGWQPFKENDVQLEFRMLDPYLRQFVKHDGKGNYSLEFKIPDVYGVFKFRILHRREGLSVLDVERQVSVRPFRHNEYERFIVAASPYYTSAFTMMAAFFVFSVVFLGTKE